MNRMKLPHTCKLIIFLLSVLLLASCGGGGSSGGGNGNVGDNKTASGYVYVADYGVLGLSGQSDISAFSINQNGELTYIPCVSGNGLVCATNFHGDSNFDSGDYPYKLDIDPAGQFLFVSSGQANYGVGVFAIDGTSGALSQIACQAGGAITCGTHNDFLTSAGTTKSVGFDAAGKYAYFINDGTSGAGDLTVFSLATGGALSLVACDAATGASCNGSNYVLGTYPDSAAVDPTGTYLYVTNSQGSPSGVASRSDIQAFSISDTGALTPIVCTSSTDVVCNGNNFLTGDSARKLLIDAAGKYVYVANDAGDISVYSIANDGSLVSVPCVSGNGVVCDTVTANTSTISVYTMGMSAAYLALDPSGKYLYAVDMINDGLAAFATSSTGTLTPIPCVSGNGVSCVTVTVNGNDLSLYAVGISPRSVVIDKTGQYLYVANKGTTDTSSAIGDVSAFAINASGTLTPVTCSSTASGVCNNNGNVATGYSPYAMAITP